MKAKIRRAALAAFFFLASGAFSAHAAPFTSVVDVPQSQPQLSGALLNSDTQYNIYPGGSVAPYTIFGWPDGSGNTTENLEVNLLGGTFGNAVQFNTGTRLNVSSGTITRSLQMYEQSAFHMTGGTVGDDTFFAHGTTVRVNGGSLGNGIIVESNDTRLTGGVIGNNMDVRSTAGLEIDGARVGRGMNINANMLAKMMSGSFAGANILNQGRIFWTGGRGGAVNVNAGGILELTGGEFRLNGQPVTGLPAGLQAGDVFTGTIADGSVVVFSSLAGEFGTPQGDAIAPGTIVLNQVPLPPVPVSPMIVGPTTPTPGGARPGSRIVVEAGGTLPEFFSATGATITQNGGNIGDGLEIHDSELIANSGSIGGTIRVIGNSRFVVKGGNVGRDILVGPGALMVIEGGTVQDNIQLNQGARMRISGGATGNIKSIDADLEITGGSVNLVQPNGGQLRMLEGSIGRLFAPDGAEVAVAGGHIGDDLYALDSKITFGGGTTCGNRGTIGSGSHLVLEDATIGNEWVVNDGCTLVMHGGAIGQDLTVSGGTLHITGGTVGARMGSSGEFVVSGGALTSPIYVGGGSLNLRGTSFAIDGADLTPDLPLGVPFTIPLRNVILSGILQDGTPFSIPLNDSPADNNGDGVIDDYVIDTATVTVTRVADPAAAIAAEMEDAGFSGADTLPGAAPFGDGVSSLLKYAFNLPTGTPGGPVMAPGGTAGLPWIKIDRIDDRVRVLMEYVRRADGSVDYHPRKSPALAPGTWIAPAATRLITHAAPGWERVRLEEWLDPTENPRQFYRVDVEIP